MCAFCDKIGPFGDRNVRVTLYDYRVRRRKSGKGEKKGATAA
jgi:hypothetical protein